MHGCVSFEEYSLYLNSFMQSSGSLKICGKYAMTSIIRLGHKKDLTCQHGCFLSNDLVDMEYIDNDMYDVDVKLRLLDANLLEWILE